MLLGLKFQLRKTQYVTPLFQGAAIIRMMDSFLGRSTFQQGLTVSSFQGM